MTIASAIWHATAPGKEKERKKRMATQIKEVVIEFQHGAAHTSSISSQSFLEPGLRACRRSLICVPHERLDKERCGKSDAGVRGNASMATITSGTCAQEAIGLPWPPQHRRIQD